MNSKFPFMSFYLEGSDVVLQFSNEFAEMSDIRKVDVLNTAMDLIMEKTGLVITSLECQRTFQAGHSRVQ